MIFLVLVLATIALQWVPELFPQLSFSQHYYWRQSAEWWLSLVPCILLFLFLETRLAHSLPALSTFVTAYANYHKHELVDLGVLIVHRLKRTLTYMLSKK